MGKRVLQVFEPGIDGVFRHVEGLVQFLVGSGIPTDIAYSSRRGSDRLLQLIQLVKDHGGSVMDLRVGNAPEVGDVAAAARICSFARRRCAGIMHLHSSKAGALGRLVGWGLGGARIFYTPNAYYGMGARGGIRALFYNGVERLLGAVGTTVNVSADEEEFAERVLRIPAGRRLRVPNAVDTARFRPGTTEERREWRALHGLPGDAIVLGTLGRMTSQKDPITLYRALAQVLPREPNVFLYHLGQGELEGQLASMRGESRIGRQIIHERYLSNPEAFFRPLDAFVLTSRYEGLSFAVLEALASGLPLVLTRAPGNADFLRLGLDRVEAAAVGDPESVGAAITRLLGSIRGGLGNNHRENAVRHFSFETCYGRLIEAYGLSRS